MHKKQPGGTDPAHGENACEARCGRDGAQQPPAPARISAEERKALLALDFEAAVVALENDDPLAFALTTEFILFYSEKVGEELKHGRDYLPLLTPCPDTPSLERIAMDIVLESVEAELDREYQDP